MVAVFLSLQQLLVAVAVDLVQQVFPLAHFLVFFLPVSAKAIPETITTAVASKNNFFIIIYLIPVNIRPKRQAAKAKLLKL
jgi:hypothetical protein